MSDTQSQAAARQVNPAPPEWPKLMYNVNLPPKLVYGLAEMAALGDAWRAQDLSPMFPDVPGVDIDPAEETFLASGGPGSIDVTITSAGQSGTWTATKDADADWLIITEPDEPQSTDGQVLYTVALNPGPLRTAHIYINGKTHTVMQEAAIRP